MNDFQRETCCLHFETIFTKEYRGLIEFGHMVQKQSPKVQHQQNHNELVVDYNSLNMDAAAKMQQISKMWMLHTTHMFNLGTKEIYTISTLSRETPKISVGNSVSDQISNTPSVLDLL